MRSFIWQLALCLAISGPFACAADHATGLATPSKVKLIKASGNLLLAGTWKNEGRQPFERQGEMFICDNGSDTQADRSVGQDLWLHQLVPEPVFAVAYSKAEGVTGQADPDYSLHLDIDYADGTHLWAQCATFSTGTHDWQRREVYVMPAKPIRSLSFYMLFRRRHGGKALFRMPELYVVKKPEGSAPAVNGPQPVELVEAEAAKSSQPTAPAVVPNTGPSRSGTEAPVRLVKASENLLAAGEWQTGKQGFRREREMFVCDNGSDARAERGLRQTVVLNQTAPQPVFAFAHSKAEDVVGQADADYSLRLDMNHADGTLVSQQCAPYGAGTHDWQRREIYVMPEKPIQSVTFYMLLRHHAGKAMFRLPEMYVVNRPDGNAPVTVNRTEPVELLEAQNAAPAKPAAEEHPITIAILDFEDKGPSIELAPLRTALAEMLVGDLSQYQGVRVVERFRVDQLLRERNLQRGFVDSAAAAQVAKALAAEYLLAGSFAAKGNTISVEAMLFKPLEAQPRGAWKESVPMAGLGDLERGLAEKILGAVGIAKPVHRAPPQPKRGPSPVVAVLGLKNLSPSSRLDAMQSGFAEALQSHLGAIGYIRLVERERLYEVLKEQKLSLAGLTDPQTAIRVGKLLGAERLIYGSFVELGKTLRLDLRLVDTQTAAVLRAEAATGATDRFSVLLEDLALRLAADLAIAPPAGAADRVKGATMTRSLEAAIHLAEADESFHLGRYVEAAKRYERVLLVEPKHAYAAVQRGDAWLNAHEYRQAIEAGEQALAAGIVPRGSQLKLSLYSVLGRSHGELNHHDRVVELDRMKDAEFPSSGYFGANEWMKAEHLCDAGRREEGVALLENAVEEQKAKGDLARYADALQTLHQFYYLGGGVSWQRKENGAPLPLSKEAAEIRKKAAVRSLELHDRIVAEAEKMPRSVWWYWQDAWAVKSVTAVYYDEGEPGNPHVLGAEPQVKEARLVRLLRVFPDNHKMAWEGGLKLAELREEKGDWKGAVEAYRGMLKAAAFIKLEEVPDFCDVNIVRRDDRFDRMILARCRIADILREHLNNASEAREEYRRLIEEFGLAHDWGMQIAKGLHALGGGLPDFGRAAIVWGGGDRAWIAWSDLLRPMGYRVHRLAQYHLSTAHLAPYDLVILVRTGRLPYSPEDALALRNHVAAGGSLLVVVCPGWEPGQPGIHNPLLSFFGVHAGHKMAVRTASTRIAEHPITKGTSKVFAKNAVDLQTPPERVLAQAGDRNVLVATPYRQGRVVVASLGQWFLPDPAMNVANPPTWGPHWTNDVPDADLPLEVGDNLHLPLLMNVLAWLSSPSADEETVRQRKLWSDAMAKGLQAQFQIIPEEELKKALQSFVDDAKPGFWKEEALWAAGETTLNLTYRVGHGTDHRSRYEGHFKPKTEFYARLVREFPQSPLSPFAKWRYADCKRREGGEPVEGQSDPTIAEGPESLEALFEKISAPKESYAWAWTELRLGVSHFRAKNYEKAKEHFRKVAESLDPGPEKGMALFNTALCHRLLGNKAEAIRLYQAAETLPDVKFWSYGRYEDWAPLNAEGRDASGTSLNEDAEVWLKRLGAKKHKE